MAQPLRYIGEPFLKDGVWWREGHRRPYRVWDQVDTSSEHRGECDQDCRACLLLQPHSQRLHRLSVLAGRKAAAAVCTPARRSLRPR